MGTKKESVENCCCSGTCCSPRCLPKDCITGDVNVCDNPLPLFLTCDLSATPSYGTFTCFDGSGTLEFIPTVDGGLCCWEGTISGTCIDCNGVPFDWTVFIVVCCGENGWTITADPGAPCVMGVGASVITSTLCDLILLEGCFDAFPITSCVVACFPGPVPGPEYILCFQIYEVP